MIIEPGLLDSHDQLPRPLHHNLTAYALAAGTAGVTLLALSPTAEAQIVYTRPTRPSITIMKSSSISITTA